MLTDLQKIAFMRGLAEAIELIARGETNSARILIDDWRNNLMLDVAKNAAEARGGYSG